MNDPQIEALLRQIDAEPNNPNLVALLGTRFEEIGDVRADCIRWAIRWGRMPHDGDSYCFVTLNSRFKNSVLNLFHPKVVHIPNRMVYRASEAWIALCDRWAEMAIDEREAVVKRAEELWGGKA